MRKRHKLSNRFSKKLFTRTAKKVNRRNVHANPLRGGIRM